MLKAFIAVSKEDTDKVPAIEKELRILCEKKLPPCARPVYYKFLNNLPLTAAGKVDYRALEKMVESADGRRTISNGEVA